MDLLTSFLHASFDPCFVYNEQFKLCSHNSAFADVFKCNLNQTAQTPLLQTFAADYFRNVQPIVARWHKELQTKGILSDEFVQQIEHPLYEAMTYRTIYVPTEKWCLVSVKLKDSVSRRKTQFFNVLSHEIRTSLTSIVGAADMLFRSKLNKKQEEYVSTLHSPCKHLLSTVNDILTFNALEDGDVPVNREKFKFIDAVVAACGSAEQTALKKNTHFAITYLPSRNDISELTLIGDSVKVTEILKTLMDVVIRFSSDDKIFFTAAIEREVPEEVELECRISLNNRFPPALLINLTSSTTLSPKHATNSNASNSVNSTLGTSCIRLRICQKLAEIIKGNVTLEDTDAGSTIVCTFRFYKYGSKADHSLKLSSSSQISKHASPQAIADPAKSNDTSSSVKASVQQKPKSAPQAVLHTIEETDCAINPPSFSSSTFIVTPLEDKVSSSSSSTSTILSSDSDEAPFSERTPDADKWTRRILLVEDEPINQKIIRAMLHNLKYKDVTLVTNGLDALKEHAKSLQEGKPFHVVLLDQSLHNEDGDDVCSKLKAADPGQIVVSISANVYLSQNERYRVAGYDDALCKPVFVNHLKEVLDKWCRVFDVRKEGKPKDEGLVAVSKRLMQAEGKAGLRFAGGGV
ncbi:hypothetical protein BKA69DRAFT_1073625 [Paraphysoderma sedebokerense]|nr:hypothetical protein BKA69DRAFT_1073625 [Paraphysoderma sedebokerense]